MSNRELSAILPSGCRFISVDPVISNALGAAPALVLAFLHFRSGVCEPDSNGLRWVRIGEADLGTLLGRGRASAAATIGQLVDAGLVVSRNGRGFDKTRRYAVRYDSIREQFGECFSAHVPTRDSGSSGRAMDRHPDARFPSNRLTASCAIEELGFAPPMKKENNFNNQIKKAASDSAIPERYRGDFRRLSALMGMSEEACNGS